jgi:TonB family protein
MSQDRLSQHSSGPIVLSLIFFISSSCCYAQQALDAKQLIVESNAASDIFKLNSFRLQAQVVVMSEKGNATGTLTFDHDHDNTRQELDFTDYHEVRLVRGNTSSLVRKPVIAVYVAEHIRDLERLWQVRMPSDVEAGAVTQMKIRGVEQLCFILKPGKDARVRHCFDLKSHLLAETESTSHGRTVETLFLDYQKIGDVQFPTTIRLVEQDKAPVEMRKISVANQTFDEARFAPIPGAREFQTCRDLQPPRLIHSVDPDYPQMARVAHIQGEVRLLVVVGEDGKTHDVRLVSGHPLLAQAAMDAVKSWKYTPASCPSGPVSVESLVSVSFHM